MQTELCPNKVCTGCLMLGCVFSMATVASGVFAYRSYGSDAHPGFGFRYPCRSGIAEWWGPASTLRLQLCSGLRCFVCASCAPVQALASS